ncbi:hypothetical protein PUN28_018031 [Cardiocondyla obscurior]|uniref:Uncharacterized protein n=1 Tax=Cardiocondyla obscurior TaxID=286306 RepID=A0AAW2EFH2_9HYME
MAFQRRKRGPRTIRPTSYRRSERRTRPRASAESSHGWTSREGKEARGQSALRLTDVLRGGGGLGEASCFSGVDPWIQLRCCALVILVGCTIFLYLVSKHFGWDNQIIH